MSKERMFIRFGVHKDREVLKQLRDNFAGMVIPAHILAHSSDATRVAVDYIERSYFIDPMTYILTSDNIECYITNNKEKDGIKFKMSIEKLTSDYGLLEFFTNRDYKALQPDDFTPDFINSFCKKNYEFQTNKLNSQAESAYKKYSDILAEVDPDDFKLVNHQPRFIIPPYFFSNKVDDQWHTINIQLAKKTLELCTKSQLVAPIILTTASNLTSGLIDAYDDFSEIILWITDLDEAKSSTDAAQIKKLTNLRKFIESASTRNKNVTNLYGSYYSAMLTKYGLTSFSNGIFYGEFKDYRKKVGGGAPPVRFYISALHSFYLIPVALAIFQNDPDLFDQEPEASKKMLGYAFENISTMSLNHTLAQKHFLYAREQELNDIRSKTKEVVLNDLSLNFNQHGNYPDIIKEEKPVQLVAWGKSLEDEPQGSSGATSTP